MFLSTSIASQFSFLKNPLALLLNCLKLEPMEYRRFGKTNEMLSVITLGGMRFKHGWVPPRNHLPKESVKNCLDTTRQAFDLGINHIETAHGYVKSEHLYGAVLKELNVPREQFKMMTKGAPMTADETRSLVEDQLTALKLDYVDFYGWHGINNKEQLDAAVKTGGRSKLCCGCKSRGWCVTSDFPPTGLWTLFWRR